MAKLAGFTIRAIHGTWGIAVGNLGAATCPAWIWRNGRLEFTPTVPTTCIGLALAEPPPKDELDAARAQVKSW